jgi:hypothetical protein
VIQENIANRSSDDTRRLATQGKEKIYNKRTAPKFQAIEGMPGNATIAKKIHRAQTCMTRDNDRFFKGHLDRYDSCATYRDNCLRDGTPRKLVFESGVRAEDSDGEPVHRPVPVPKARATAEPKGKGNGKNKGKTKGGKSSRGPWAATLAAASVWQHANSLASEEGTTSRCLPTGGAENRYDLSVHFGLDVYALILFIAVCSFLAGAATVILRQRYKVKGDQITHKDVVRISSRISYEIRDEEPRFRGRGAQACDGHSPAAAGGDPDDSDAETIAANAARIYGPPAAAAPPPVPRYYFWMTSHGERIHIDKDCAERVSKTNIWQKRVCKLCAPNGV